MAKQLTDDSAAKGDTGTKTLEGQFEDSPAGWARYWSIEFAAARKEGSESWTGIQNFQERGERIVKRYRAKAQKGANTPRNAKLNLFAANIQTQRAILVGQVPKCEVSRRYEDQGDDDARVASTMLERILNQGLEEENTGFASVIARCTEDRLLPGICGSRVQFGADFVEVPAEPPMMGPCPACQGSGFVAAPPMLPPMPPTADATMPPAGMGEPQPCPNCQGSGQVEKAPAKPASEKPTNERADVKYQNWRDQMWSVARTFEEVRWWAFSAELSRKQLKDLFGEEEGSKIPVSSGRKGAANRDAKKETPWSRATVWEIWSREHKRVFHYVEGHSRVIFPVDNPAGEDPLGLDDFWPFPAPMIANATSDAYLPTPDFEYAKDLYDEADELTSRIRAIVRMIKVVGTRDKANKALDRLLDEACEGELVPVANWQKYLAVGGLAKSFELLPIAEMVQTVQSLVAERNIVIENIYQVTGLSDIIRGQQQQSETATTSAIKARYASVRLQDLQKDVARYATDLQRLRKEVIAKHWSIETIIERSAIMQSEDGQTPEGQERILRAAQLIKDKHLDFRVVIKPEQISLQDWAQLKQQRSEVLTALGGFFQSSIPMIQLAGQQGAGAAAGKFVLGAAQWLVAGMPGSSGLEAQFDTLIAEIDKAAKQAAATPPKPPPPDPKVVQQQLKNQGELQKRAADTQGRLLEINAERQSNMAQREHDARMDVLTDAAKSEQRMRIDAVKQVAAVTGPLLNPGGVA